MDVKHWGVDIRVNGERVLTIESICLSGVDDIAKYREVIQGCAHHLLGFIGDGKPDDTLELGTDSQQLKAAIELLKKCCGLTKYDHSYEELHNQVLAFVQRAAV